MNSVKGKIIIDKRVNHNVQFTNMISFGWNNGVRLNGTCIINSNNADGNFDYILLIEM